MADLKLNGLLKDGVLLEEHSACEVPAGCGGVVLRWVRAGGPIVVQVDLWAPGQVEAWVDGSPLERGRTQVTLGRHALCVRGALPLLVQVQVDRARVLHPSLQSAPDGSWLASSADAPPGWTAVDWPAEGWAPMVEGPPPVAADRFSAYQRERLVQLGARPLTLPDAAALAGPEGAARVLVRRVFELDALGIR